MAQFVEVEHRGFEATLARCAEVGGVDAIFTSPPYPTENPGARGKAGAPTRDYGGDAPKHFLWHDYQALGNLCFEALKPGGFCIVIVDGPIRTCRKTVGSERSLIAFKLAIDWAERVGFRYVEHEAYVRLGPPGDFRPRRRSGWEPMHIFQRPGSRGFFDAWATPMPSKSAGRTDQNDKGSRDWKGQVRYRGRSDGSPYQRREERTLTTAINATKIGPSLGKQSIDIEHRAPFTEWIAKVQVCAYCPLGGITCDPFNGSGTTGIAAAKHGRSFIGGDLGARERDGRRWADIGRERAEAAMAEFAASVGVSPADPAALPQATIASDRGQMKLL